MNGLRNIFALYAIGAAGLAFFTLMHVMPLLTISQPVFIGDRLPEHVAVVSATPTVRHTLHAQNPNTLVKPASD